VYSVVSHGRCSLFPSRIGLRTYQHPCSLISAASTLPLTKNACVGPTYAAALNTVLITSLANALNSADQRHLFMKLRWEQSNLGS